MNDIRFDGRVAVVTGAGNGLGRGYALELARRGASVVVNDLGSNTRGEGASGQAADAVVAEIRAAGGQAVASHESVATRAGGAAIVEQAVHAYGRLDILINNAGILRNAEFEDLTDADLDALIDVHLKGAFHLTQPAYRVMKEQRYGRVLFTTSAAGLFGSPTQAGYAAAKSGLVGLMQSVALEGRAHGILANALAPTAISRMAQDMTPQWMARVTFPPEMAAVMPYTGLPFVTPLALYLVSEACEATRHVYSCAGGRYGRVVTGVGEGWMCEGETPPAVEDMARHFAAIDSANGLYEPRDVGDETAPVAARRSRQAGQA